MGPGSRSSTSAAALTAGVVVAVALLSGVASTAIADASAAAPARPAGHSAPTHPNLVRNGSFTHPDGAIGQPGTNNVGYFTEFCVHAGRNAYCPKTDAHFGSWTVARGSVDLQADTYFTPPAQSTAGAQCVDLDGFQAGAIEQTIATVKHRRYELSFAFSGNPGGNSNAVSRRRVKHLRVLVDGHGIHRYTVNTKGKTQTDLKWKREHLVFTAPSAATTLTFASTDAKRSSAGPLVAAITVIKR